MKTNKSLLLASMACFAMFLYAKSVPFGITWVTWVFFFTTIALGTTGFIVGLWGAREKRTALGWLAPGINAFIVVMFIAYFVLLMWGLHRLQ